MDGNKLREFVHLLFWCPKSVHLCLDCSPNACMDQRIYCYHVTDLLFTKDSKIESTMLMVISGINVLRFFRIHAEKLLFYLLFSWGFSRFWLNSKVKSVPFLEERIWFFSSLTLKKNWNVLNETLLLLCLLVHTGWKEPSVWKVPHLYRTLGHKQ